MISTSIIQKIKSITLALCMFIAFSGFAQSHDHHDHPVIEKKKKTKLSKDLALFNPFGIDNQTWKAYHEKASKVIEDVDVKSYITYIFMKNDGNLNDIPAFLDYVAAKLLEDKQALILKVGKGEITKENIGFFLSSLQPKYEPYLISFKEFRKSIVDNYSVRAQSGGTPTPFNCGSPCTNPGFEAGTGFWDYWSATACASSSSDPCGLTAGYNPVLHQLMTAGPYDPIVGGTILPVVPPGGGTNALMLGDGTIGGQAARASISFTVSATNANFTYKYAVVLEDPVAGHADEERPYFSVKIRDAAGNVLPCGDYYVSAKPPISDFTQVGTSNYYYRNWTTIFVPLSSYIGQCITVEFTSSECAQTGHLGYAYIDAECDPLEIVTSSPAVCGGSSIILTAPAGGASYSWTNTAGGTTGIVGSTTGQTVTVDQAGTYQVVITSVAGPSCTTTLQITVGSAPAAPVAGFTNTTVCAGNATVFTDTSTPVGSVDAWAWDFNNDGVTDDTNQNPSYVFGAAGTYPVNLIVSWGPCNDNIIQSVTVGPGPVLVITNPAAVCSPGTVDITAPAVTAGSTGGGTLSYWNDAGATSALASPNAVATSGTYYIQVVNGACSDIEPVVVTINPLPVSNAGPDVTICHNTTGNLGTPLTAGYTYSWTPGTGLSSAVVSDPTVTLTNGGAAPVTTNYVVTTTTAGGCSTTDAVDVTVNPLATANAGPPQTVCAGSTVTLAGVIGGAATSGTWGGGGGSYSPSNNDLNAVYTPSAAEELAGSVTLTLVSNDPAGPCPVATSTMTITINPIATVNAGPDQTICIGNTATLACIFGGAATGGTWTGGAGAYAPSNTDPNAVYTPTAAEEAAGSVTLTYTTIDPAGPCPSVVDDMVLTISPLPSANAGLDQTICNGSSAILNGSVGGAATSGTWSGGTGTYTPNSTTLNASYTPSAAELAAGTVSLTLTTNDPTGPCTSANDVMVIIINPVATVNAGPDQTICIGSTVTCAASIGGSASSGTWSGGAGAYAPSNTDPNAVYTPTAAEEAAGTVTLTYTTDDPIGPCPLVTDDFVITINQLPTANAGVSQSVCVGSTFTLGGSVGGVATGGTWSGGGGTYAPNNATLNAVYTPSAAEYAAGYVQLLLTTNDPAGPCSSDTASVYHYFFQNPVVDFTVDDPDGCPVHCVQFTDQSTVGGGATIVSWNWTFDDGSPSDNAQDPAHCFSSSGYYDITLTVTSNQGCTTTLVEPDYIFVFPVPIAGFTPNPVGATVLDPEIVMMNQSSPDVVAWDWNFGDGDSVAVNEPFNSDPTHIYPDVANSSYWVTLVVTNNYGCMDTVQHQVFIGPEFTFFIPNAFTPNGDGVNDFFWGQGIGIAVYDLWIFDRWGDLIWHGDHEDKKWDGKANGGLEVAQQDVYVWKVKLLDVFGKTHRYMGTVTLVK